MNLKFLLGEIASQPAVVTLDSAKCTIVYVLIKVGEAYRKFYYLARIREHPSGIYLPNSLFSNILVSSVGDKVKIGVISTSDDAISIQEFVNYTRGFGVK